MRFILVAILLAFSSVSHADETEDGQRIIYKQKTEIDFEGIELQGELVKPQGALLLDRKRANFNPLIKLRKDFDDEMDESVDEIK
tara:strand:- start:437 stop:691 length:255 start_codon:yes stop_codon:yes gene_type:complete